MKNPATLKRFHYLTVREAAAAAEEEEDLYLVRAEGDGLESAMNPGNVIVHANKKAH